jgi:hypothetical protein
MLQAISFAMGYVTERRSASRLSTVSSIPYRGLTMRRQSDRGGDLRRAPHSFSSTGFIARHTEGITDRRRHLRYSEAECFGEVGCILITHPQP